MEQAKIDEIKARCDKATPGPWFGGVDLNKSAFDVIGPKENIAAVPNIRNTDFIAHSRSRESIGGKA